MCLFQKQARICKTQPKTETRLSLGLRNLWGPLRRTEMMKARRYRNVHSKCLLVVVARLLNSGFSDPVRTEPSPPFQASIASHPISFKEPPLSILTFLATFHSSSFEFRYTHQDPTSLSLDRLYNHGLGRLIWPLRRQQMAQVVA